jgi:hypothetical protein
MEDAFTLTVDFEGEKLELPARVLHYGYTLKIEVQIESISVIFEPDEEGNWRAVMGFEDLVSGKKIKSGLVADVAELIAKVLK